MLGIVLDAKAVAAVASLQADRRAPALQLTARLQQAGLMVVPSGTHVLRWLPPLNVTWADVESAVAICSDVLGAL